MILKFAWRYFKGKKSTQAIQIISWVSILGMAVGTASLIIVLSVFNGFEFFIKNLYTHFYPDIKITAVSGKYFHVNDTLIHKLKSVPGIQNVSKTLEEKVLLSFGENQAIVNLKGIDAQYDSVTQIKGMIEYGNFDWDTSQEFSPVLLGIGVANKLGVSEESPLPVNCYAFRKETSLSIDPTQIYNNHLLQVSGLFVLPENDNQYAFTHIEAVRQLAEKNDACTSLEIALKKNENAEKMQKKLQKILDPLHLKSANRYEQNKTLFFILKSEKLAVFAILSMMLFIASFNIVGSLSMLVIEKEKDIAILKTLGMQNKSITKIFMATGILISMIGACIGSVLAFLICWLQMQFGFVKLGDSGNFLMDAYPVKLSIIDFLLVMATVVFIAILASWIPSVKASRKKIELRVR